MPQRATPLREGGGRPKIDWADALVFFLSDPRLGYGDVARKYGVTEGAVRKHAKAGADLEEGWEARRQALIAQATARAESRIVRALEQRQADTVRVAELLRGRVLELDEDDADEKLDLELAVRMLPQYAKLEALFAGEATDRVHVMEAKELVDELTAIARVFVDDVEGSKQERRERFLSMLEKVRPLQAAAA